MSIISSTAIYLFSHYFVSILIGKLNSLDVLHKGSVGGMNEQVAEGQKRKSLRETPLDVCTNVGNNGTYKESSVSVYLR